MKTIILITGLLLANFALAQVPERMSYQAIIRNSEGQVIVNQNISTKVSILQNSDTGTVVYSERVTGTTNTNGLISLVIGSGTPISGAFNTIDWSTGNYYLKTETDPTGGTNYTIAGTSQLLSVPYALYAKTSGSGSGGASQWTLNGNDISNTNSGKVGIGTTTPTTKLSVKVNGAGISQVSKDDTVNMGFYTDTNMAYVQTNSDHDLKFATANAPAQMTLQKTTGNLGIGIAIPTEKLEVNGKTKTTNLQMTNGAATGKVLTSDATGNASWKSAAYNNTERFQFALTKLKGNYSQGTLSTIYNFGTATAFHQSNSSSFEKGIRIAINKPGLYHFNFNAFAESYRSAPSVYKISDSNDIIFNQTSPYYQETNTYAHTGLSTSYEVYVDTPRTFFFSTDFDGDNTSDYYKIVVTGHLISE